MSNKFNTRFTVEDLLTELSKELASYKGYEVNFVGTDKDLNAKYKIEVCPLSATVDIVISTRDLLSDWID